jgi:nucleoside-diphosphate-sugar epimerase
MTSAPSGNGEVDEGELDRTLDALRSGARSHRGAGSVKRILVLGGAGYLGSVLVRRLLDRGYGATVFDALMYGDESIRELYGHPHFRLCRGDLRDAEAVERVSSDADAVVHLGALVGDPACALDEELAREINLEATRTVATISRGLGISQFIFASTCGAYGASDDLVDEDSPLEPVSLYAQTKVDAEALLLSMSRTPFNPVILRFGTFYGASSRARFDLVVNLLVAKAVVEGEITISGGSLWRPFIHVADGAEAIIRFLEAPAGVVSRQVFNVGADEENHTLAGIGDIVAAAVPGVRIHLTDGAKGVANYRVSFARITKELGFVPTRTVADGVAEIKAAIEGGAIGDYADIRYSNVKSLAEGESTRALETSPPGLPAIESAG